MEEVRKKVTFEDAVMEQPLRGPSVEADSLMQQWIIRTSGGLVRNKNQANAVLLVLVVILAAIAGAVEFLGSDVDMEDDIPFGQRELLEKMDPHSAI